ncbi:MAG: helix-turn-helix transcriptional regulator [bacterium]|nr:helix-turn-helix transcriptional regulator [bacterium]
MLREKLCEALVNYKENSGCTYSDLSQLTGLSKSQLTNICKNNGKEVKLETIENALYNCGVSLILEFNV